MPFDPASLVRLADFLVSDDGIPVEEQCRFRTALNRAYYGPLCVLIARIEEVQGTGTVPTEGTHQKIRQALKDTAITHLQQIRHKLDSLRVGREEADYVVSREAFSRTRAEDAVAKASDLVRQLRRSVPDEHIARLSF